MKTKVLLSAAVLLLIVFSACEKSNLGPQKKTTSTLSQGDTSTMLITNTSLVGTWNVVTDTISFNAYIMYHGKPGDHYTFTKYGNLYASKTLNGFIDTGVYKISHDTVSWVSSYVAEGGGYIKGPVSTPPYVVSSLTTTSLILTSNMITPDGIYYEQIRLSKAN
jgi:hypothetical protein